MRSNTISSFVVPLIILIFQSCCSTKQISLGNGFKLSEYSVKEVSILFCDDRCCNIGATVIPQTVRAFNFDKNWIIAKSDSTYYDNRDEFAYWIFDKNISSSTATIQASIKANLSGPLDSTTFYEKLKAKNIEIELINYPN